MMDRRSVPGRSGSVLALFRTGRRIPGPARLVLAALWATLAGTLPAAAQFTCPAPEALQFEAQRAIRRSETGFTQGLEVRDGALLEGTGSVGGSSVVNRIDPASGSVRRMVDLGTSVFGEGLTVLGDRIYQLTWMDRKVFVRDLEGKLIREMRNEREGWGLTNDGTNLIFSDGSGALFVADPQTFAVKRVIEVRAAAPMAIRGINELEHVQGKVYANIFGDWVILRIDLRTGCIDGFSDLSVLQRQMDPQERAHIGSDSNHVLNGIAYDAAADLFYVTGKRWHTIFAGRFRRVAR